MFTIELIGTAVVGIVVVAAIGYLLSTVNSIRAELQQSKAVTMSTVDRLGAEFADKYGALAKELQAARSEINSALAELSNGMSEQIAMRLGESVKTNAVAIDAVTRKLELHDEAVNAAIAELKQAHNERFEEVAKALEKESSPSPPQQASSQLMVTAADTAIVAVPGETAMAEAESSQPQAAETPAAGEQHAVSAAAEPSSARVINWSDLPEKSRELWNRKVTELTIPPVSYDPSQKEESPKEMIEKIKHDPMLCAKILAVANSAAQGQIKPVTSIERAAVQLGTNILQIIIAAYQMEAIFGHYPQYSREHFQFVQRWSCGASVVAYHLAALSGSYEKAMLSTVALISRLGSLLLGVADVVPDLHYREIGCEVQRYSFEMDHWGVSTPLLSERVALHWGLPEPMPTLLRLQERPLFAELSKSQLDTDLMVICLAAVITSAYITTRCDDLRTVLENSNCEVLHQNIIARNMHEAIAEVWQSKALQREFLSILE